jgi:diguanylate cyclase (GGDEF)-like protein
VGDQLLRQFAQRVQRLVRPTDAVARLGGDEFAVALPGVRQRENAEAVADKIVRAAQEPFEVGSLVLRVGASVGVAFKADEETGWQGLVERADNRLYQAKSEGRGRKA